MLNSFEHEKDCITSGPECRFSGNVARLHATAYSHSNPYKPRVLFVGHRQTVQNQIKTRRLICFSTVCKHKFLLKFEEKSKSPPNNPKIGNGLEQLITMGKYIRHKWVKNHSFTITECMYIAGIWLQTKLF